jgi:hypothetical protein
MYKRRHIFHINIANTKRKLLNNNHAQAPTTIPAYSHNATKSVLSYPLLLPVNKLKTI